MNLKFLLLPTLIICSSIQSQKVFFKSPQSFTEGELDDLYCSFRIEKDVILFNAPDYSLYAFSKGTGTLRWSQPLYFKTNHPPRVINNKVWANANGGVQVFEMESGRKVRDLPLGSIESEPFIRNGILYATGIVDGGRVFAYDLAADTLLWSRFIAHGCSRQPYYYQDKIIANAEGDQWIEVNYDGRLSTPGCELEEFSFPSELPCVRKFQALTHDGKEIGDLLGDEFFGWSYRIPAVESTGDTTFAFFDNTLYIFGNNLHKTSISLDKLAKDVDWDENSFQQIAHIDRDLIWIQHGSRIFIVNYRKKTLQRIVDLSTWGPHQLQVDGNKIWLISRFDGRLYGLTI